MTEPARLRDLAQDGADLLMTCENPGCRRIVEVSLDDVLSRQDPATPVRAVQARCGECGSRDVEVRPLWRRTPGIVTNHMPDPDPMDDAPG